MLDLAARANLVTSLGTLCAIGRKLSATTCGGASGTCGAEVSRVLDLAAFGQAGVSTPELTHLSVLKINHRGSITAAKPRRHASESYPWASGNEVAHAPAGMALSGVPDLRLR